MKMLFGYLMFLIGMIPSIIILIGCIILWARMRSPDVMLMLIGRSLCIITSVMSLVFGRIVAPDALGINYARVIASTVGSLIFAVGFLHVAKSVGPGT